VLVRTREFGEIEESSLASSGVPKPDDIEHGSPTCSDTMGGVIEQ